MINPYLKNNKLDETLRKLNAEQVDERTYIITPLQECKKIYAELDKYYLIKLSNSILYPNEADTLHTNWNRGFIPKYNVYKCCITQILGKMVRIDGIAYDLASCADLDEILSDFWIPINDMEILKKL